MCHVSAVSRGRSPGNCFTPRGVPALCHHGRSGYQPLPLVPSPDGVVVCTAKRFQKRRSPPIELANTTNSVKGSTKRGIVVQARTAQYPNKWGAFTLFPYDDARCGSKPALWRCRVFFTKERVHHEIPKGQLVEAGHECLLSAPTSPPKIMDAPSPARKAHAHEMLKKAGSISNTRGGLPVREDMKKRLSTKHVY